MHVHTHTPTVTGPQKLGFAFAIPEKVTGCIRGSTDTDGKGLVTLAEPNSHL